MSKSAIAIAIAASLSIAPAFGAASESKLDQVMDQLSALSKRVDKLEQEKAKLEADNADLKSRNDRLEATTTELRTNAADAKKQLAADAPKLEKLGELEKSVKASEWASRITWKGDFRLRHENVDPEEAVTDQTRERIRLRFGFAAKINDSITGNFQLATNGGNGDPRSTNQTLGNGWDRKGLAVDLAYVDWKAVTGLNIQGGKMPLPFQRVGSFMWDGDITPEGAAVKYANGPFFGSAFSFVLSERAAASDATMSGAQVGLMHDFGAFKLTGAVGYFDVGAAQGKVTAQPTGCATAFNPVFFGGAQGNSTVTVAGCPRLLDDFNLIEALGQAEFKLGKLPLVVFADYLKNNEADDLDSAYSAGVTLGRATNPGDWEIGYVYQKAEKDSQFGQFIDSDFGGGITDTDGHAFRFGISLAKNWVFNGTYFLNNRFVDVGTQRDYKRYQIDLNYRY